MAYNTTANKVTDSLAAIVHEFFKVALSLKFTLKDSFLRRYFIDVFLVCKVQPDSPEKCCSFLKTRLQQQCLE